MSGDPHLYPRTTVSKNKFNIRDAGKLDYEERYFASERATYGVPAGDFDLAHLQSIHRHLFQDVYAWAGEIRTVEITKGGHQFMFRQYIQNRMADVHRRIVAANAFAGLTRSAFAQEAGRVIGDVNYVDPFREGNGRTQLLYLKQLCSSAGHLLDLRQIAADAWLEASKRAHGADYGPMSETIEAALERSGSGASD